MSVCCEQEVRVSEFFNTSQQEKSEQANKQQHMEQIPGFTQCSSLGEPSIHCELHI